MKAWQGRYNGETALILCNGPSLNKVDFDSLDRARVFTFGLNKINLLFEKTTFRPDCIVAVNRFVLHQNRSFFNTTDIPLFVAEQGRRWVKPQDHVHLMHTAGHMGHFARDCSMSVNQGGTVTYVAMQLAFHMGFANVGLVGCDHSFRTKGPAHSQVKGGTTDPDHFDPGYFAKGVTWELPDLTSSEYHYEKALEIYNLFGRHLLNCTEGGKLEVLPRMDLTTFLNRNGQLYSHKRF